MKKFPLLLSSLLLVTACAKAPGDQAAMPQEKVKEPIKIGVLAVLTGDAASFGTDILNGVRLAVQEINAAGGANGNPVQLIAEDGRCNGADSSSAAQKLVNVDKVHAIVGGGCSSETLGAAPIAEAGRVVMISPSSSSPEVTKAGDFIFRNYPSDGLKGGALARYLTQKGYQKVAIVSENTDFCVGLKGAFTEAVEEPLAIVFDETVEPGTKDYRSLLTRLKKVDFDVFFANGQSDTTVAAMVTQMRELGITQPVIGSDVADSVTLGKIATEAVEGLRALTIPALDESNPSGRAFNDAFRAEFGEAQSTIFIAATAYDAAKLLVATMGEVGTEGAKVRDALYALDGYTGIAGTYAFDENGDVVGIPFAMKEFKNGVPMEVELIPIE